MNTISLQSKFGESWNVGSLNEAWPEGKKLILLAQSITSTSDEVESWSKEKIQDRDAICLVANKQDSGHGRLGRSWFAPAGKSLTMTLFFKAPRARPVGHWPLLVAWSQYRSLCSWVSSRELDIKWPNDLLLAGRKVGGSLCSARDVLGETWISAGIGLNLGPMEFPEDLKEQATCLSEHLVATSPNLEELLAAIVDSILEDAENFSRRPDQQRSLSLLLATKLRDILEQRIWDTVWHNSRTCLQRSPYGQTRQQNPGAQRQRNLSGEKKRINRSESTRRKANRKKTHEGVRTRRQLDRCGWEKRYG